MVTAGTIITTIVSGGTVLLLIALIILLFARKHTIGKTFQQYALTVGFLTSLLAMLISLYYSEIVHFEPCQLCWYQRIFLYPQVLLFGIALFRKDTTVYRYTLSLSIIGGVIALYHYLIQIIPNSPTLCSTASVSCASSPFFGFGFVTIPLMSFAAFATLLVCSIALRSEKT
ncbi:MAG: hypothetical protein QT02_C0004G0035 [archaeon GW2011_AR9]|nr:MAG: hypothetical protein QT02_C0004G0035 [archaeon GW2011_AR9]MBS3120395.1 disulfide bond formation protein B [Candidatus Woesearchaeota archaeon]HIG93847.1 disulfide bond formation protein B [Candidatus Woesearchaeota archaeon]HIH12798.1 disulfide bond formation protein B [Candidatus Woesearchaeota archaeon]